MDFFEPSMVALMHTCNASIQEAEAGQSLSLHIKFYVIRSI